MFLILILVDINVESGKDFLVDVVGLCLFFNDLVFVKEFVLMVSYVFIIL